MKSVPRTVIFLGIASLLTDMSSEMIYPLLPLFLTGVLGASVVALGLIEGVAETTAALLKVASGLWTDRLRRRRPFILFGYGIAGLVRPLIGFAGSWWFVLLMRFLDRLGKGIRTAPRDALIADVTDAPYRGRAFGVHRMMDHTGAVIGPLVAALLLSAAGLDMRLVFFLAVVPAMAVMAVLLIGVREPPRPAARLLASATSDGDPAKPRPAFAPGFLTLLAALLIFTLGNSSDAFILLHLSNHGVHAGWIATLWSLHHFVKMVASFYGGDWSDRLGRKAMLLAGWGVYAAVYLGFALVESTTGLVALFLAYGLYFGCVEPAERAWVVDLAPIERRGAALGWYHGVIGLAALPASLLFGLLWQRFGPDAAFLVGAALAAAAAMVLANVPQRQVSSPLV